MAHQARKRPLFVAPPVFRKNGTPVLQRVLIANRGEIACRVIKACRDQMITAIVVYADEDDTSLHVQLADEAVCIGPADQQPYQNIEQLVKVAKQTNANAVHPGYGYLSENAKFAQAVAAAGLIFIGPTPESILKLGDKRLAKEYLGAHSSVPLIPGYGRLNQEPAHLEAEADKIGYPVLIKASAGGGGKGMRVVRQKADFREAFLRCASESERSFGSAHCLIEKYVESGKHVEFQVIGDGEKFISLLDRECSIQRRHQKVIEESPCPWLSPELRQRMSDAAVEIARLLKYVSAGTVEFIVDIEQSSFYFLEVNTRIQVEHPITEEVVQIDIVALQLFIAAGGKLASLPELETIRPEGHAIEVRLCAENPFNNFLPCVGTVTLFEPVSRVTGAHVPNVRYEVGVATGSSVSVHFDSMVCKIIVWAADRASAIQKMNYVLKNTVCMGVTTNQLFLQRILLHPGFQDPAYTTSFIEMHGADLFQPVSIDYVTGPMAMAALLCDGQVGDQNTVGGPGPKTFRSIPAGFRNQRKDVKTASRKFISCQLQLLGHETAGDYMITRTVVDEYEMALIKPEPALTVAEKKSFFNKHGGPLTRRFYHATACEPAPRFEARVLQHGTSLVSIKGQDNGVVRLSIGGGQHTFFVSLLSKDEFKREVSVYSAHKGVGANYILSDPLAWAGKFELRREQQGLDPGTHIPE
ncbi:carbamoyl-phosphate synthase L chain, ATP binding domain-containing protein [Dactylonectria estremocensis]|uniref:Carbamoyl-phosphate synthase L chain, ATP binding domain-containing protein n=1 Tax=Dactylonectria estremocensis TaxID=1079267 RepID=A0A9P9ELB2_9HYPO|nr:carbamoyl-phosphate synthase L chain, ATP binding domain-containing protein [Dactylonectria estremocensis]